MTHRWTLAILVFALLAGSPDTTSAGIITISDLNADSSNANTIVGGATGAGGTITYNSSPTDLLTPSTTASYTVSNVDIDGDFNFTDWFTFTTTFVSTAGVNFNAALTQLGVSADEAITVNESITMEFVVTGDSSATHDVIFEGMYAVQMVGLGGAGFDINTFDYVIDPGTTGFSGPSHIVDPTFLYEPRAGTNQALSGTIQDWDIEFDSVTAVPEPSMVSLLSLIGGVIAIRRRKR